MEFRVLDADKQDTFYQGRYKVDGGVLTVTQENGHVTVYSPSYWQSVSHERRKSAQEDQTAVVL